MRSVRPLYLTTTCLCLAAVLTSCGSRTQSEAQPAAAGQQATATLDLFHLTPQANKYYVVEFGDNLDSIAEHYRVSLADLTRLNNLGNANEIYAGQRLLLPAAALAPTPTPEPVPIAGAKVPILLYHHLALLNETASSEWLDTTVTPQAFEEEMAYLAYHGYHTVKIMDLVAAFEGRKTLPDNPVVITFDDGWIDCYESAFPILQQYGMTATFFIPASWIGQPDNHTMSWEQIEAMSQAGMEIGSHTMTHPYLTQAEPDALTWELVDSKALLEQHIGKPVEVLAYPFGVYNDNVMEQTKAAGYQAALSIEAGVLVTSGNLFEMPRLIVPYGGDLDTFARLMHAGGPRDDASGG